MTDTLSNDLAWAEQQLRAQFGTGVRFGPPLLLPSRTGRLHRIEVIDGSRSIRYFLKQYTPHGGTDWPTHAEHLRLIGEAFSAAADVVPYQIAGVDAARRLLLAAEMPGVKLTPRLDHEVVWHGVGRCLARLHSRAWPAAVERPVALRDYTEPRLRAWAERDPGRRQLAIRAIDAVESLASRLRGPVRVTLCHRDLTSANVRVHGTLVGLIDFDDVRVDMSGVDLSQAELEIDALYRQVTVARSNEKTRRARAALREGYGAGYPEGPEFWLPHLRNLAVYLTMMAEQRSRSWRARLGLARRYRQTLVELERTVSAAR